MSNIIHLTTVDREPRADSVQIAENLGTTHKATIQLVRRYLGVFQKLGRVPFEMRSFATAGGEQTREVALLNEDQCYFLLSLSRNTPRVVDLKLRLVQAFSEARCAGAVQSLSVWYQLQAVQVEEKNSAAKGSYGSRLMNNRKREKAGLQRELARLEAQVVIPLFQNEAAA